MNIFTCCCLAVLSLVTCLNINVHGELLPQLVNYRFKSHVDSGVAQVRVRRNSPQGKGHGRAACGCKLTPDGSTNTGRPTVVVHHYHHYYYCCPNIGRHPHMTQMPHPGQNVSKPAAGSMTCECTVTGYCSCGVNCQCHHEEPKPTPAPTPKPGGDSNAFGFSLMYNDPVGKQFFDFMSKNFIPKEEPQPQNACARSASVGFDDPVCKEFFEFFSENFVRKPEPATAAPTQPPTPPPPPTQQTKQGPKVFFKEIKNMDDMKNMFDAINNKLRT